MIDAVLKTLNHFWEWLRWMDDLVGDFVLMHFLYTEELIGSFTDARTSYSKGKFYYDIIANLIWIQKGLCAYTECLLHDFEECSPKNWVSGRFLKAGLVGNFAGELDHCNPTPKENQGWLWDNFCLIDPKINQTKVKGGKIPIGILKPDRIDYNPF